MTERHAPDGPGAPGLGASKKDSTSVDETATALRNVMWEDGMSRETFDHVQLSSIKRAAEGAAEALGATKEKDKLVVARAVFDIAAETEIFETDKLIELARERLTPARGWRFNTGHG